MSCFRRQRLFGQPIEKAQKDLNYRPTINFDDGMGRVANWLDQIGFI
jgi:nucleoside-diphosphate-sugar epimerase